MWEHSSLKWTHNGDRPTVDGMMTQTRSASAGIAAPTFVAVICMCDMCL